MRNKHEIYYDKKIYCLDIETSTILIDDTSEKCSFMYSYVITSIDFYTGEYRKEYIGRTYAELDKHLNEINNITFNTSIIYIHNLAYEMSFFINNLQFFDNVDFKNQPKDDNDYQFLFLEKNKPLYLRNKKIEFRCSYQLTGMSVYSMGNAINLPKLDYKYDKIRTPLTELNSKELDYNIRDTEIVLKYLYNKIFKLNEYIKTPKNIPLTRTGITRLNMKKNPNINKKITYTNKQGKKVTTNLYSLWLYECEKYKANSLEQIKFWNDILFEGAIVYSSPSQTSKILMNIGSFDLCSDYPFQMDFRYYPKNFKEVINRKKYHFIHLIKNLKIDDLAKPKITNEYFNAIITVKNVKNKFNFYPFSISKILNIKEFRNNYNIKYINGKLISVDDVIKIPVTPITFLKLSEFYTYELVDVEYLETTREVEKSHQYMLNAVTFLAQQKSKLKTIVKDVEHKGHYDKYYLDDDTTSTLLNNCKSYTEQIDIINQLYLLSKGDLNAQYGNNAQHLLKEITLYNTDEKKYFSINDNDSYFTKKQKTSYIYGLYIPQYAQATILYIVYKFLEKNINPLYIDTDSIKTELSDTALQVVEDYNNLIKSYNCNTTNLYGFGLLEHEFTADKFISLGSKTYMIYKEHTQENEPHIKAVISGLPNATKIYNEILEQFNGNFSKLVRKTYQYGVQFDNTICTKLTSKYKYIEHTVKCDDYIEHLTSGVVLEKTDCTMKDFINNKTWYAYKHILINQYNIPPTHFNQTKISKLEYEENGEKKYKYTFT